LTEAIDTTTAPGRMMMQMVGAFAEFERAILRERTKSGLDAARKQGRIGGRRPKLRPNQQDEIATMVSAGTKTAADAARLFNVHPATVSRLLARTGVGTIGVKGVVISLRGGLSNSAPSDAMTIKLLSTAAATEPNLRSLMLRSVASAVAFSSSPGGSSDVCFPSPM
jgi:hypothetical protein